MARTSHGGTEPPHNSAQLPRSFLPRGESSGVSQGRPTNWPTRESEGRSGHSLKGGVDFNFLKRIIGGESFFFFLAKEGQEKKKRKKKGRGESQDKQNAFIYQPLDKTKRF